MSLRGRYVGVAVVVLIEFAAAMLLGIGAAEAEPRKSPFRTAQVIGPSSPEPPLSDQPPPPSPMGTSCPADPPTPSVSIRVRAPATAGAGQELEYRICVSNDSRAAAHHVMVRNPLPAHATFVRATPKPDESGSELLWRLGTLDACACREIVLVLSPTGGGDVDNCARVQFEHGQCVTTRISRPQLAVRVDGPMEAALGETLTFQITVTNSGAVETSRINLVTKFQEGWQIEGKPFEKGAAAEVTRSWDTLGPGQSQTATIQATPRIEGRLCLSAEATAAGGLSSPPARHCVNVGSRTMTLVMDGPKTAFAKRWVTYSLTVRNEGNLPATDVVVTDPLPEGLTFLDADQGGVFADRQVRWRIGALGSKQSRVLRLRVQADAEREVVQRPLATAAGGLKASTEFATKFQGAASFDFDAVVPLNEYAVEVGSVVRFQIPIYNPGTGKQSNVRVVVELPPQMEFQAARFDALKFRVDKEKGIVTFDPLSELAPNRTVVYEVNAIARKVGEARATVRVGTGTERPADKQVSVTIGEKQPP